MSPSGADESAGDDTRTVVVAKSPDGTEYRIMTAVRGIPLTGLTIAGDLTSAILELVIEGVAAVTAKRSSVRKIGVYEVRGMGPMRRRFKCRVPTLEETRDLVQALVEEIQRGEFRWRAAGTP